MPEYMADKLPIRADAAAARNDRGPEGQIGPFTDAKHDIPAGGEWAPQSQGMPESSPSGNASVFSPGFNADAPNPPLPPPGSSQGNGLPPSGDRK